MRTPFITTLFLSALMGISCQSNASNTSTTEEVGSNADIETPAEVSAPAESNSEIPLGAQALIDAYPKFIKGYADNKIIFTDGTTMVYDDGKKKDFVTMLDNSDIEDMFWTPYVDIEGQDPAYLNDAGRSRNEALFKKMYGSSQGAVSKTLAPVKWVTGTVQFTTVNGANKALEAVARELEKYPELKKYLKSSGTFYWRQVRGAKRMSAHSYGIAFDIGVDHSDYWLWKTKGASETAKVKYANRIPHKIAEIFRKHGFIWGGAWYHFDTMHFEYRPEILRYAELLEAQSKK